MESFMKFGEIIVTLVVFALWMMQAAAAQCPTRLAPSDVLDSVTYNYSATPFKEMLAQLHKTVPATLEQNGGAYSVALVHRNNIIFSSGLTRTPFRIGSVTQCFTAMGALLLRERGVLSLDDPVNKFLPAFSVIDHYAGHHDITLRELMGHVSGLPRDLCGVDNACGSFSEAQALQSVATMQLARPAWSNLPAISNLGFAVLGHAWEKATTAKSWSDFVRDEIVHPLRMSGTGVDLSNVKLAPGFLDDRGTPANASVGWVAPAAEMYSTAIDLAKFLVFVMNSDKRLLSAASIREWTHINTLFPDYTKGSISGLALPWEILTTTTNSTSSTLITKSGLIGTYSSFIGFHPDSQIGIAVLMSSASPNASSTTGSSSPSLLTLATGILGDVIPVVETLNSNIVSSFYSGTYICNRTAAIANPDLPHHIGVVGGQIDVTYSQAQGLQALVNVTLTKDGTETYNVFPSSLVLKNSTDQTFWVEPGGDCMTLVESISNMPQLSKPNSPGSVYLYELQFFPRTKMLHWPSLGAVCQKS